MYHVCKFIDQLMDTDTTRIVIKTRESNHELITFMFKLHSFDEKIVSGRYELLNQNLQTKQLKLVLAFFEKKCCINLVIMPERLRNKLLLCFSYICSK